MDEAIKDLELDNTVRTKEPYTADEGADSLQQKFRSAALLGDVAVLKGMLAAKLVDVNAANPLTHQTALHSACTSCNLEVVKLLLDQENIDLEPRDTYGNTPLDLLSKGKSENSIRNLIKKKIDSRGGTTLKRSDDVTPLAKIANGKFAAHVFIVHDYKNRVVAQKISKLLEAQKFIVAMTKSMMVDAAAVKTQISKSKLVLVLASKDLLQKLQDPQSFARSSSVVEMDSFIEARDIADVLVAGIDSKSKDESCWRNNCPEYDWVVEEGIVFDLSNDAAFDENFPALVKELKLRTKA